MKKYLQIFAIMLSLVLILSSVGAVNTFALQCEDFYADQDSIYGDVDGDLRVTVKDATAVQKSLAKLTELELYSRLMADVNGDGKLSISDATDIQKYLALIINSFAVAPSELYTADTDAITIDIKDVSYATLKEFSVYIPSTGYYRFTADFVEGYGESFYVGYNELMPLVLNFSFADADTLECFAYIPQGYYKAGVYAINYEDAKVNFSITSASEDLMPFNIKEAKEIKAGEKVEIKAGAAQQIFKVNADDCFGSLAMVYTEGADPKVRVASYSEQLALTGMSEKCADRVNSKLLVADNNYLVVNQEEGGSDFTLCLMDYISFLEPDAEVISLNEAKEITFSEEDKVEIDGVVHYENEVFYKFTPAESGYYMVDVTCPEYFLVEDEQPGVWTEPEGNRFINHLTIDDIESYAVDYLEAGNTYLMKYEAEVDTPDKIVSVLLSTADEQDYYDYIHYYDYINEELDIENATEIALGGKAEVNLSLATDDEGYITSETKVFRFTADKDMKIVVYSEGSQDACAEIYTDQRESVWYGVGAENISQDFAIALALEEGESCYIEVSGGYGSGNGDSYTLSVVDIDDYKPVFN